MTDKDYNKNKSNHKQNRIGPITITNKGKLPRGKTKNNRNLKFELVAEDGKQSYWATLHEKPNCNEVARTLASMPHKLTGTFLVDCFQSDWYKANPNLVIDVMAILMQDGYIDQDDCDIVFSKTYPFSEAKWVEDTEWKADAIKALTKLNPNFSDLSKERQEKQIKSYMNAQNLKKGGYVKKKRKRKPYKPSSFVKMKGRKKYI